MATTESTLADAARLGVARILVVEDDAPLRAMLQSDLEAAGYQVVAVGTAGEGTFHAEEDPFDLIVLDLNLPDGDGIEIAERLGGDDDPPVLMLTARADLDSRLRGLYAGASDYVAKPFSLPELRARIHVRLRERRGQGHPRYGALSLDPDVAVLTGPAGDAQLPDREATLLRLFMDHPGRVFGRADLERRLYGPDEQPASNTVEVFVHHLRRKLEAVAAEAKIHTVRGKGYLFR